MPYNIQKPAESGFPSISNGGEQIVVIADNGEGMKEELQEQVFKGYISSDKEYWRHGIGLYVSHQIIEAHGGRIWIESKLGEGTTVTFTLPDEEKISYERGKTDYSCGRGRTDVLRINARMLTRRGYTVYTAENCRQAYERMEAPTPDLLILDIMLPDGSGLRYLRKVPQHERPTR